MIEAVAMDMSPAYHAAVSTHLSKATIVYDHFHVIKLFNEKLSNLRRSLYHQAEDQQNTRIRAKGMRQALIDQKGWTDEELPHVNTIGVILNRLGYKEFRQNKLSV